MRPACSDVSKPVGLNNVPVFGCCGFEQSILVNGDGVLINDVHSLLLGRQLPPPHTGAPSAFDSFLSWVEIEKVPTHFVIRFGADDCIQGTFLTVEHAT